MLVCINLAIFRPLPALRTSFLLPSKLIGASLLLPAASHCTMATAQAAPTAQAASEARQVLPLNLGWQFRNTDAHPNAPAPPTCPPPPLPAAVPLTLTPNTLL